MTHWFTSPEIWASLFTLTALEIVLGVDNLVFLTIITDRLPLAQRKSARRFGLILACVTRLILLAAVNSLTHFVQPLFSLFHQVFSLRDLILIGGGLFLLVKGTGELHNTMEPNETLNKKQRKSSRWGWVIVQIMFLDIIFSLDSVITAVGMAQLFMVMALAIIMAITLMLFASEILSRFIQKYPTLKTLGLSFLLLVGLVLIAGGFKFDLPRPYLYFAIAFSTFVEIINILIKNKTKKSSF